MDKLLSFVGGINFDALRELDFTSTAVIAGVAVFFIVVYGFSLGREKALASLLGIYVALAFSAAFPYIRNIHEAIGLTDDIYTTRIVLFMVIYLVFFLVLKNSFSRGKLAMRDSSYFAVSMVSLSQVGLLIAVITNIIPNNILDDLPEYLSAYFGSGLALAFWIVLPIVLLFIFRKSKRRVSSPAA